MSSADLSRETECIGGQPPTIIRSLRPNGSITDEVGSMDVKGPHDVEAAPRFGSNTFSAFLSGHGVKCPILSRGMPYYDP